MHTTNDTQHDIICVIQQDKNNRHTLHTHTETHAHARTHTRIHINIHTLQTTHTTHMFYTIYVRMRNNLPAYIKAESISMEFAFNNKMADVHATTKYSSSLRTILQEVLSMCVVINHKIKVFLHITLGKMRIDDLKIQKACCCLV